MAENGRRRTSSAQPKSVGEEEVAVVAVEEENSMKASSPTADELDGAKTQLRKRWELASVLNFLGVFEPLIEGNLKLTAEQIEMALIKPDASLAKIHIALLKGIPPVNKSLTKPDVWVTILCKKLAEWWSWVAEGEIPLNADKGEEIARYKELDPIKRLLMLKALCEVRTEQDDFVSYINDMLKQGSEPSSFRKSKVGEDGNSTSYWYDGNDVIGHRLYREVDKYEFKSKHRSRKYTTPPVNNLQWDTLATNLDEFHKVLDEFSSSKVDAEVAVCKSIETKVIPVLEKLQKKRERALKRQQRENTLLNREHAYVSGVTRSCRIRNPVKYTFDEYDQAIDEAIQITKKGYPANKHGGRVNVVTDTESDDHDSQRDGSIDSMDTEHENDEMEEEENATHSEKDFSLEKDDNGGGSEADRIDHDFANDNSGDIKNLKPKIQEQTKTKANGSIQVLTRRLNSLRNHSNVKRSAMNKPMESPIASDSDNGSSSKDLSEQDKSLVAADSEEET
ncbi:hypothetical protein V2J09_013700 [Rumex salicifolius]